MRTLEHLQPNSCLPAVIDLTKIKFTSVALKKGKPVKKALDARRSHLVNDGSDSYRLYIVDKTNRDFQRWRLPLEPGCIIDDETGSYEVLSVINLIKYPKTPFFFTKQVASKTTTMKEDLL